MVSLEKLIESTKEAIKEGIIPVGDGQIKIKYDSNKLTPDSEEELQKLLEGGAPIRSMAFFFLTMVNEWDLVDEAGNPVPLEMDTFVAMGAPTIKYLVERFSEINNPKLPTSEEFDAGSSAKAGRHRRSS